jgi:hypothetical protein
MPVMAPAPAAAQISRVLLLTDRPTAPRDPMEGRIRRFKLARLRLEDRSEGAGRHAHLRESHD